MTHPFGELDRLGPSAHHRPISPLVVRRSPRDRGTAEPLGLFPFSGGPRPKGRRACGGVSDALFEHIDGLWSGFAKPMAARAEGDDMATDV